MDKRVGFIGLGNMGAPMTRRLVEAGYEVWGYDVRPELVENLRETGGHGAASIGEVAERVPVILLCLPDSSVVESVIEGEGGLLSIAKAGQLIFDMSSSYPPSTVRLGGLLKAKGVDFLDAPVSGGVRGAVAGTLTVMVGGDERLSEKWEGLLCVFGPNIFHAGALGTGHTLKALNNLLSASSLVAASEALILATRLGLDPDRVIEVLNQSTGRSDATVTKFPKFILPRTFDAGFPVGLLRKDVSIALRLAKEEKIPMHSGKIVEQILTYAANTGAADWDHTALIRILEDWTGEKVQGRASRPE